MSNLHVIASQRNGCIWVHHLESSPFPYTNQRDRPFSMRLQTGRMTDRKKCQHSLLKLRFSLNYGGGERTAHLEITHIC